MTNIETKEIGIDIGINQGTFSNTKIEDNKLVLDYVVNDNNEKIYKKEGSWTSEVIDLVDKFKEYDKVVLSKEVPDGANYAILVRVSDDGNNFSDYIPTTPDGSFQLDPKRYVQVKIDLFAGYRPSLTSYDFDKEEDVNEWEDNTYIEADGVLKLKRDYQFEMEENLSWSDEGHLFNEPISREKWKKIDSLSTKNPSKTLILSEEGYKKCVSPKEKIEMPVKNMILSTSSTVMRTNHLEFNEDCTINKIGYYTPTNGTLGLRIFDKDIGTLIYSSNISTVAGWNDVAIPNIKFIKNKEYLIGFYGSNIYGYTSSDFVSPLISISEDGAIQLKTYGRIDATADILPTTPTNTTALILRFEVLLDGGWKTVSPTLPTLAQFQEEGMDDLSILDRKVQQVLDSPQQMTSESLGEGKVFKGTVDLKKYFDLRKLEVK